MRLFKSSYRDRRGRKRETAKWYCEFRDHRETIRRIPAFNTRAASEETLRNLAQLTAFRKASGGRTDPSLLVWLENLPARIKARLVEIGLIDAEAATATKTLAEHLDDFAVTLAAGDVSAKQVELVTGRARRIIEGCNFRYWSDIQASKAMVYLGDLRAGRIVTSRRSKQGIGAQTFNFYLGALKQFCSWMVKDRRARENPVTHLDGVNTRVDRRHDRRALSVDEIRTLLDVTLNGPDVLGIAGPDRCVLYRIAVETALRAGELRSLTRASFDLNGAEPTVTVTAAYAKGRRTDTLPLRVETAAMLRTTSRRVRRPRSRSGCRVRTA